MSIFSEASISKMKNLASEPSIYESVFSPGEIEELIEIEKASSDNIMVDRADSRKTEVNWNSRAKDIVMPRLEELLGKEVIIGDFPAHFIINRYPLRVHVDMGRDPHVIPYKNILIPLSVSEPVETYTILFDKRWYDIGSLFVSRDRATGGSNDYTFKDKNGKFVYVPDSNKFVNKLRENVDQDVKYLGGTFEATRSTIGEVEALLGQKRYQQRTCDHITSDEQFDKVQHDKYLTHQPREDLTSLTIKKIIPWTVGNVIAFDRSTLHCASNFLEQGIKEKMALVMFTVWED
mgnify:CR=1 FL=1